MHKWVNHGGTPLTYIDLETRVSCGMWRMDAMERDQVNYRSARGSIFRGRIAYASVAVVPFWVGG